MNKQKRRPLISEWTAGFLVEWLNGPDSQDQNAWAKKMRDRFQGGWMISPKQAGGIDAQARKRVEGLLHGLHDLTGKVALLNLQPGGALDRSAWLAFEAAAAGISKILGRYTSYPELLCNQRYLDREGNWHPAEFIWANVQRGSSTPPQELRAVDVIRDAVRRGWIDRIRRCAQCKKWFIAPKPWSTGCSSPCRKELRQAYQTSEEYKKRRRKILSN